MDIYITLRSYLHDLLSRNNLLHDRVEVKGEILSNEEAIGNTERRDLPLLKGKEKLLEADYKGSKGQAYTDSPYSFSGTLQDFLDMPLQSNFQKAAFTAVLNAVMRHLGLVEGTIHCKNEEINKCAEKLIPYIQEKYGCPNIGLIGLQPVLLDSVAKIFPVRVVDLNSENVGQEKHGVLIEDALNSTNDVLEWCDLLLVTGSTVANGSIITFLELKKPVIFYGTTIAGTAKVLGLERFCACSA